MSEPLTNNEAMYEALIAGFEEAIVIGIASVWRLAIHHQLSLENL